MKEKNKKNIETFEMKELLRSQIFLADYNPRNISEANKKKLKRSLKQNGLVTPIIVNLKTNNIVAGHQRVLILDEINNNTEYKINAACIDVDEKKEKELNIFLNNTSAMGEWNKDLLYDIKINFPELDFKNDLGFDQTDLNFLFSGFEMEGLLFNSSEHIKTISEIEKMANSDKMKEYKKKSREKFKKENEEGTSDYIQNQDYYVTFVFNNSLDKQNFLKIIKQKPEEKYLKFSVLFDFLKDEYQNF